jgi:aminoglycoside phosphotransferase family enzyme
VQNEGDPPRAAECPIGQKVLALSQPSIYGLSGRGDVVVLETHMSFVFLAGENAYKLKKAVRLPYLDFSTLAKREHACRLELSLNRRLAPGIYLAVRPLRAVDGRLVVGGEDGAVVDWLVVMRRLNRDNTLEHALACGKIDLAWIERLESLLLEFYRCARPARLAHVRRIEEWRRLLRTNRDVLLRSRFTLPVATVLEIDRSQQLFLDRCACLMTERKRDGRIVNGHGDLRPEHVFVNATISIIDCLEFNAGLRAIDPFEEIACLAVECERHGEEWIGNRLFRQMTLNLPAPAPQALVVFYMCYRATLRARLCIAHLLEPHPRTPEKWRPLALVYLAIARKHAAELSQRVKARTDRSARDPHATARWRRRKAPPRESLRS